LHFDTAARQELISSEAKVVRLEKKIAKLKRAKQFRKAITSETLSVVLIKVT
jgi:hypothetical protein